jgi:plastocyanin
MKKSTIIVLVILIIVLVIIGIYFGSKSTPAVAPAVTTPVTGIPTTEQKIAIQNFAFSPQTITVAAGTKVTWTNEDSAPHQIKSDTFNSNNLNTGESFSFTFDQVGTYDYICSIHPSMTGKIIVQ